MRNFTKKQICLIFFLVLLLNTSNNCANASVDVVRAKTISTEQVDYDNSISNQLDEQNVSEIKTEKKDSQTFTSRVKNFFKRRSNNDSSEDVMDELIEENDNSMIDSDVSKKSESQNQENYSKNSKINSNISSSTQRESLKIDNKNIYQINARKVTYDDIDGNVYADGNVEIIAKAQGVVLKSDKAVLEKSTQLLKLSDNVRIIKDNVEMKGESLVVDLNEENVLMDNPSMNAYSFVISAQEGFLIANDIQMLNGTIKSTKKTVYPLMSRGFMRLDPSYGDLNFINKEKKDYSSVETKQRYRIDAKEIVLTSYKDHNSVILKGSNVFYNNHKIVRNSDIEIISDKENQIVEINAPEAGNLRGFGTYAGYGHVFKIPGGNTLKLMPVLAYSQSDAGVGIIGRFRSPNSSLEGGWNTASSNLILRGRYKFNNALSLNYGRNAYIPEGFMGARRSGYASQLMYRKSYFVDDLKVHFTNSVSAGIFSDYQKHDQEDAYSTTRFRYMASLMKELYKYENKEQDFKFSFRGIVQGAGTVYGSGETHALIRVAPVITTKYKKWEQSFGYYTTGTHGTSPFLFDLYRYGKSTFSLNQKINFNDKLALGCRLYVTPKKDNYEEDLLTEARFYLIFGPEDLKLALSYDFVRDIAHLNFMFLVGSNNSNITFEKLTTKDIDGKNERRDFYKSIKPVKIQKPNENI